MGAHFRHEMKYIITKSQYDEMSRVLGVIMKHDQNIKENNMYNIRSLYFDDIYRTAYNEKLEGIQLRKKYRIRIYGCADKLISLECKHKNGPYIYKEDVKISKEEYDCMLRGNYGFLLKKDSQMAKEFFIDARTNILRPVVIVDYDREPFVNDVGTVRITFDKKVRGVDWNEDMFNPDIPSFSILPEEQLILEIKFTGLLPEKIRRIFRGYRLVQTSASKYCMCMDIIDQILRNR